jgi:hypothetical protein
LYLIDQVEQFIVEVVPIVVVVSCPLEELGKRFTQPLFLECFELDAEPEQLGVVRFGKSRCSALFDVKGPIASLCSAEKQPSIFAVGPP